MPAYQAGSARVSSTVTKRNPRPRKYASASERQAAYRARAPEVCFRAEAKTVETLDSIAETLDQPRADLLLSMTKFALANHDWARFGLTHKPLPYGYGLAEQEFVGPRMSNPNKPIWERTRPKSLGKPVPLTPKQKTAAKKRAAAAGRPYPNLVDNIAAARLENPTVKKPTPAQLAARARFAEMARSGAFKRKAKAKRKENPTGMTWLVHLVGKPESWYATKASKAAATRLANQLNRQAGAIKYEVSEAGWSRKTNPAKKTVSQKISQLVREGYPQKQAVAVALSEQRAGKVKATPRKRNPRAANPIDPMGGYGPLYGHSIEGMSESKIEYIAERYMDRLDRDLMSGAITAAQYERDTKALNKWVKEAMSKRKRNPAKRGRKPSIKVGDYVRSYDFPGTRDDFYLEGVVTKIGNGVYLIDVSRRIVEGMEKPVTPSLRKVQAPIEPNFFTGVYGVQKLTRMDNPRAANPATGRKESRTKLNPKPRMAKIAWLTPGGQREVMEVPIDFAFKEYIGNIQEDFFARTDDGFLVVTEKSTGMRVGQVPHTMRAAALNDKAAAKRFVQSIAEKVGAPAFRAAIAKHPRIA